MINRLVIAFASLISLYLATTDAKAQVAGLWSGQCTRPGHQPANGQLVIRPPTYSFFGGPMSQPNLMGGISFTTTSGSSGTTRNFTGTFGPNFSITGVLTQSNQKYADCSFAYQGP